MASRHGTCKGQCRELLARCHHSLGACWFVLGKLGDAEAEFRRAIEIWGERVAAAPRVVDLRVHLCQSTRQLAAIFALQGHCAGRR